MRHPSTPAGLLKPDALVARVPELGVIARDSLPPEVVASLAGRIEAFGQIERSEP